MTNPALGTYQAVSAPGQTDPFTLSADGTAFVGSIATSISGTLQVYLEMQDLDGNWQSITTLTAQTTAGAQWSVVQPSNVLPGVTTTARLRWTCTGGDATFAGIIIGI